MNIFSAIDFTLAAVNFACMIISICNGFDLWWINFASGVFCFCMGFVVLD